MTAVAEPTVTCPSWYDNNSGEYGCQDEHYSRTQYVPATAGLPASTDPSRERAFRWSGSRSSSRPATATRCLPDLHGRHAGARLDLRVPEARELARLLQEAIDRSARSRRQRQACPAVKDDRPERTLTSVVSTGSLRRVGFLKWLLACGVALPLMVGGACFVFLGITEEASMVLYGVPAALLGVGVWRVATGESITGR